LTVYRIRSTVNPITIAVPLVIVILLIAFLCLIVRLRRRSLQSKTPPVDQPFLLPVAHSTDTLNVIHNSPPTFIPDIKCLESSSSSIASLPAQDRNSTDSHTTTQQLPYLNHPNSVDINQVVDLVAARIDPGPSGNSALGNSPQTNVNIDAILSLLAARVDPLHQDRDPQDLPPSYQIPPDYDEDIV
jgi:hypothetical protein